MRFFKVLVLFIFLISCKNDEVQSKVKSEVLFSPSPNTKEKSMLSTFEGWEAYPLFTVGEAIDSYLPLGALDGIGVKPNGDNIKIFVNHELSDYVGYAYNSIFKGARISSFNLNLNNLKTSGASIAFTSSFDRQNELITNTSQIYDSSTKGFHNFCSGGFFQKGTFNLNDDIYVAGEEWENGQVVVLDTNTKQLHIAPALGWGGWENITFVDTGLTDKVAALLSDDHSDSPMYLYVGTKNSTGDFLDRNGLKNGDIYVWVADDGSNNYNSFKGNGSTKAGKFKKIPFKGRQTIIFSKYDNLGFLKNRGLQITEAIRLNYFVFNRPEDIHTNPNNTKEIIFSTTGINSSNKYGTINTLNLDFTDLNNIKANAKIIYDCNITGENGIRNPDNLVWADSVE